MLGLFLFGTARQRNDRRNIMAMKIVQAECTSCGDCKPVCPTKSITDKGGMYKINVDTCTECEGEHDSPACLDACPAGESCIVFI
jgi:ferredoxin